MVNTENKMKKECKYNTKKIIKAQEKREEKRNNYKNSQKTITKWNKYKIIPPNFYFIFFKEGWWKGVFCDTLL